MCIADVVHFRGDGYAPLRESNNADMERSEAGVSDAGRTHENNSCGLSIVGDVQEVDPMVTSDGGVTAPKFKPETGEGTGA